MILYVLDFAYHLFGVVVGIIILILVATAFRLAQTHQNQGLLRWLWPMLIAHSISALYWSIFLVLRVVAASSTWSLLLGIVLGSITGLIDIFAAVRLLAWVRTYLQGQNNTPWNQTAPPTQGVWPPPPSTPGR